MLFLKQIKMDLKQAVRILEAHNRWRRGEDVEPMVEPSGIGFAIDTLIEHVKNNGVLDDVIRSYECIMDSDNPNCDCEINQCKKKGW